MPTLINALVTSFITSWRLSQSNLRLTRYRGRFQVIQVLRRQVTGR